MTWRLFTAAEVMQLHDAVLNEGELQGMSGSKSLEGALSRVEFRVNYGMVTDVYDLAAMYAVAISQAHVFNDANKRTAHATMKACLKIHGVNWFVLTSVIGDKIIDVAQGKVDETQLAAWLREQATG